MQLREIEKGVDVLVATPGRLLTLIGRKKLKLDSNETSKKQMQNNKGVIIDQELFDMLTPAEKKKYLAGELEVEAGDMKSEDLEINQEDNQMENLPEESEDKTPEGKINLRHVNFLVLDEVDRMLGMGLFPDVRNIYNYLPKPNKGRLGNMQVRSVVHQSVLKYFSGYHDVRNAHATY